MVCSCCLKASAGNASSKKDIERDTRKLKRVQLVFIR